MFYEVTIKWILTLFFPRERESLSGVFDKPIFELCMNVRYICEILKLNHQIIF